MKLHPIYPILENSEEKNNQFVGLFFTGWTIGMIFALLFLVLVCVIVFLVKQNRGGKYSVQEREELHGRRDPYDDGGFPEFTQP